MREARLVPVISVIPLLISVHPLAHLGVNRSPQQEEL
jgi:hypothetical protein